MSAPQTPLAMMATIRPAVSGVPSGASNFLARWVTLQNRNRMQPAESRADIMLIMRAICVASLAKSVNNLPNSMKNGAPGGCPTSIFSAVVINSGQSQKLAVGSMVEQ